MKFSKLEKEVFVSRKLAECTKVLSLVSSNNKMLYVNFASTSMHKRFCLQTENLLYASVSRCCLPEIISKKSFRQIFRFCNPINTSRPNYIQFTISSFFIKLKYFFFYSHFLFFYGKKKSCEISQRETKKKLRKNVKKTNGSQTRITLRFFFLLLEKQTLCQAKSDLLF